MKPCTRARSSRHDGFTLLELLIAMTIGMILTLVVSLLFVGSRRTYATTDDASRVQENMRYTHQLLNRMVHLAGYKSSPNTKTEEIFNAANPVLRATEGGGTAPDALTVSFQGNSNGTTIAADGSIIDCLGTSVPAGVTAINTFTIANGAPALFCAVGNPAGTPVEIVPNVANMQILYGVDDNADLVADRYVPATGVALDNGRSIRFAFLFVSPTASALLSDSQKLDKFGAATARTYDLNGVSVGPFNDKFTRRAFTMTVSMRNRTP